MEQTVPVEPVMTLRFYQWMVVVTFVAVFDVSLGAETRLWRDIAWATVVFAGAIIYDTVA